MSTIDDLPVRPEMGEDFGQGFNYNVWTPNTTIQLCKVPWNSDYRDIVGFNSQLDLDNYLNSNAAQPFKLERLTLCRVGDPIRINIPFNIAYKYNYLRVVNPIMPVSGTVYQNGKPVEISDTPRSYYYFIQDVRYISPSTTELIIQLDVWQSFGYDIEFGNCYIERGHIGIANEHALDNWGTDYLTIPEGFDLGSDYVTSKSYSKDLASAADNGYSVVVLSTVLLDGNWGDVNGPVLKSATGDQAEALPNGAKHYVYQTLGDFLAFANAVSTAPWVSQGIIGVWIVPTINDLYLTANPDITYDGTTFSSFSINSDAGVYGADSIVLDTDGLIPDPEGPLLGWRTTFFQNENDTNDNASIPYRYRHLTKFLTAPYCMIELTTYHGQPLVLRPELWGANLFVLRYQHWIQPNPQITFIPKGYGSRGRGSGPGIANSHDDDGEFWDMQTSITNFPQFSVVNNGYLAYMAANRNRIAFQYQNADWSQQRALMGVENQYNQAGMGNDVFNANQYANQAFTSRQALLNTEYGGVGGALGTVGGMNADPVHDVARLLTGGAQIALQASKNNADLNNQLNLMQTTQDNSSNLNKYLRDTNMQLGVKVAIGDYSNEIAGINAQVRDARLIQPSVSGQSGGEAALLVNYGWHLIAKIKTPQLAYIRNIGEYWLRYGYAINRFAVPPKNFRCMEKFTYWKMKETYIKKWNCPESFRQSIRGIFEKGVTVWTSPDDIGTIDIGNNEPLRGITL